MNSSSRWSGSIQLDVQGRHLVFLLLGGTLFLFMAFCVGVTIGKRLSTPTQTPTQNLDEKQLDCIDWVEAQIRQKTQNTP